jgi:hypothetical protein
LSLEDEVPNHSTFSKINTTIFGTAISFAGCSMKCCVVAWTQIWSKAKALSWTPASSKANASRQRGVPGDEQVNWSDPALSTRAVREYLEALDEEALAETLPKRLSLTDPQARWTAAPGGPAFYAYSTNYLIDIEHGVIMDGQACCACKTLAGARYMDRSLVI